MVGCLEVSERKLEDDLLRFASVNAEKPVWKSVLFKFFSMFKALPFSFYVFSLAVDRVHCDLGFEILNLISKDLWIEIIFKMWIVVWKLCFNFVNRKNNPNFTPQVKMNRIEERIRQIMESENLSQQDFAKLLEISPASLSSIFNGRTRPTHNHTNAIHKAFPNLNINWLLFGEGEMYEKTASNVNTSVNDEDNINSAAVKVYDNIQNKRPADPDGPDVLRGGYQTSFFENRDLRESGKNSKNFDIRPRQVKEIRVFYDDGTYESFVPQK